MKRALLIALALIGVVGFTALGAWQVERRAWKLDLIERVETGIKAAPVPLTASTDFAEYRRVRVEGTYFYDRETLVKAVTARGEGFWVLTPLRTPYGVVLVNRGFVPSAHGTRWQGAGCGERGVIGLMRASEPGGGFLRSNDPTADRWFSRDIAAIAKARDLGPVAPFFIDADATPNPGGYPIGGLTVVTFRNNHLVYALTWFALAALCAAAAVFAWRQPGRR